MLKRTATSELNQNNWDDEEEQEKPSDFKLASAEVMSKRIIKTGKRRLAGTTASTVAASPFSKFSFGGASGQTASSPSAPATPSFNFLSGQPPSANGLTQTETKKADGKDKPDDKQATYLAKLKGLNEELLSWIESHFKKNPTSIFTPVFEDYNKYLKEIQAERDSKNSSSAPSVTASPYSGFKFSVDPPPKLTAASGSTTSPAAALTPAAASSAAALTPAAAKSETSKSTSSSGSIFGNTGNNPDQPGKSSIFGNAESKPNDAPFSFGGSKPFSFGNVANPLSSGASASSTDAAASEVRNDEDSEEPPKNEFKPVTEDDAVFSQRVKVFVKKDEDYADRGVGTLFIKPANSKFQALVRADTSLGNLLLNIILAESMPIKRMGKNNVMLVCVPLPGSDAKPLPTLLRVKTKEEADKLFDELNKYKK